MDAEKNKNEWQCIIMSVNALRYIRRESTSELYSHLAYTVFPQINALVWAAYIDIVYQAWM